MSRSFELLNQLNRCTGQQAYLFLEEPDVIKAPPLAVPQAVNLIAQDDKSYRQMKEERQASKTER
jgi:hypothetical protein